MHTRWIIAIVFACVAGGCDDSPSRITVESLPDTYLTLTGGARELPIQINDVGYTTVLNIGNANVLEVFEAGEADPVVFDQHPISATYFHMGKMLEVKCGKGDARTSTFFVTPRRWRSRPAGTATTKQRGSTDEPADGAEQTIADEPAGDDAD